MLDSMGISDCPFCLIAEESNENELIAVNRSAVAFFDKYPVSQGHALVIPKRHEGNFFRLLPEEQLDVWKLLNEVHLVLSDMFQPDGFNVGINVAEAGGQTVEHAHVHLIPRYGGDIEDPRGGVRWVIPGKAPYWGTK